MNYDEEAALVHAALVAIMNTPRGDPFGPLRRSMLMLGHVTRDGRAEREAIDILKNEAIPVLQGYLEERLDSVRLLVTLLSRYKERVELFKRAQLRQAALRKGGEAAIKLDLFEYLHERGIDYQVEPKTAAGRPDLLARVLSKDLVVEVKFVSADFTPTRIRREVAQGVRQAVEYAKERGVPVGYLVVFIDHPVHLIVGTRGEDGTVRVGGIGIHAVTIDIHKHKAYPSKRGKMTVITVPDDALVRAAQ